MMVLRDAYAQKLGKVTLDMIHVTFVPALFAPARLEATDRICCCKYWFIE